MIEAIGNDPLDDPPDGVPPDPQQPGDRGLGHLLRQPRDDIFEVAGVVRAGPGPRDRLEVNTTVWAAKATQLGFDHAPAGAEIQVAPALEPPVVDLEMTASLAAAPTHPTSAPQANRDDHPLGPKADVDDRGARQAQQPVECGCDAHVALLRGRLNFDIQQPAVESGGASPQPAQPPNESIVAKALLTRQTRQSAHPQVDRRPLSHRTAVPSR